MPTLLSHNPAETEALGEAWGRAADSGLVLGLSGDLGAGKTQLVKGLARGLGITARVHSPTFALVHVYEGGRLTLFHLDLYRLDTPEEILSAGLDDYLRPDGVTVIEWAEKVPSLKSTIHSLQSTQPGTQGKDHAIRNTQRAAPLLRWVNIEVLKETERRIMYEDIGA